MCIGIASGYIEPKEEKKTSLLKRKTNFDNLKDMSALDFAEKLTNVELNAAMVFCIGSPEEYSSVKEERKKDWLEWLESEAEG